jgi:hypothetical protein
MEFLHVKYTTDLDKKDRFLCSGDLNWYTSLSENGLHSTSCLHTTVEYIMKVAGVKDILEISSPTYEVLPYSMTIIV